MIGAGSVLSHESEHLLAARSFCTKILQFIIFWRKLAVVSPLNRQDFMYPLGYFLAFRSSRYAVDFGVFQNSEVKIPEH